MINKSKFILVFISSGTHYFSIVLFKRPLTYSPDWTAEYILPLLIGWASKFFIGVTIDSWSKLTKNAIDCRSFDSFDVETWCLKENCNLFLKYGFFKKYVVISWEMKFCWVGHFQSSKLDFTLIKTLERITFFSNQNIGVEKSNFDDWKCPTQQSSIPQEMNS